MAGTNNFLVFDENKVNIMSDANYSDSNARKGGNQPGVADPVLYNKLYYQTSIMTAALAQSLANKNFNVSDADFNALVSVLGELVVQTELDSEVTNINAEISNKVGKTETGYRVRKWVSGEYTPVLNTPCIVNHGLDIDPENCIYDVRLKCAVAEGGYSIGDYAIGWYTTASIGSQGTTHAPVPKLTASAIQFNTGDYTSSTTNGIGMLNKNSGAYVKATLANWRYVFRIFY